MDFTDLAANISTIHVVFWGGVLVGGYYGALAVVLYFDWKRRNWEASQVDAMMVSPLTCGPGQVPLRSGADVGRASLVEYYEKPEYPGVKFVRMVLAK